MVDHDARNTNERWTRKYYIHQTKGLQEAKIYLQTEFKECDEQRVNEQTGEVERAFTVRDTSEA